MAIPNHDPSRRRSASQLLSIPRKVRDPIYEHHVIVDRGYVYESDGLLGGRLKWADRQPFDLNLTYACQLVVGEMRHLALQSNTITLSTITSEDGHFYAVALEGLRIRAARFHGLVGRSLDRCKQ
ncbi:hypothetical protein BDP55DRAFT_730657 [Colletotrichum godetiae]|uniref:Uncharacterized protein n=1 Tax=Colletotrichum godetiae TaxID=1209918 RepID=A0AAJ0AG01_9PEZI|nr:uncharacterized protein BDP55DRAFT_730657 [Colletotrichum godetiae]KAK1673200.1 hypothetical protein BDP55DRAFT_730657 [Colletotrichum godetiae]